MIKRVYEVLKTDSRKGDIVYLVAQDFFDLEIDLSEDEIQGMAKNHWKTFVHETVTLKASTSLTEQNMTQTKTMHK